MKATITQSGENINIVFSENPADKNVGNIDAVSVDIKANHLWHAIKEYADDNRQIPKEDLKITLGMVGV